MRLSYSPAILLLAFSSAAWAGPCGFPVNRGPPGTTSRTNRAPCAAGATLTINDMLASITVNFTTTATGFGSETISYTGGNWDFTFTATYIPRTFNDEYTISGTARHVKKADAADLNNAGGLSNYTLAIDSKGTAAPGPKVDGPKNDSKAHQPHTDVYAYTLTGTIVADGALNLHSSFTPVVFSLTGEHQQITPPSSVPEPVAFWLNGFGILVGVMLSRLRRNRAA